ncbi:DUF309 domain-containing protein [Paenibacillus sp. GCM10023248]|uniref:DUF309 domain-containing protein n=1 Tax=Bacillales TaxID=1385 RepID=UPI002379A0AF|nr:MULTISPECIES: DUF309 domain-containing protein [Bacillales]MDD9267763.1 DUF309 domain-containing protein [Paenibacillus sp. MAHUQ-63]MDR6882224.1 putative metal-dependent hydrolase [Bacillus sp. 3255]
MRQYPEDYLEYLLQFHAERDYFECHEIMEEFWKEHPGDVRSKTYVALIQIAVGMYHIRRGNRPGAVKMLQSSLRNAQAEHVASLGLDAEELVRLIRDTLTQIEQDGYSYADINLPIADAGLLALCTAECRRRGLNWQAPSRLEDSELTEKHTRRDRSGVIEERARQYQIRKEKGGAK